MIGLKDNSTATFPAELSSAIEAISIAEATMRTGEALVREAMLQLRDAARRYLMEAEEDSERLARATFVYWNLPDVQVSVIASVLLGDERKSHAVSLMLPEVTTTECRCGQRMKIRTRDQLKRLRQEKNSILCEDCKESDSKAATLKFEAQVADTRERLRLLRSMPYREYLLTEEWLETRNRKLRQAKFQCQLCNARGLLNVHHRTYERRGCEDMADLTVLCRDCHAKFHDKLP